MHSGRMTTQPDGAEAVRAAMRRDLVVALKSRATDTAAALRTAIAAVDNAEAVDTTNRAAGTEDGPVAGATAGLGSSEVARRTLSVADARNVVAAVISEYVDEAERYESLTRGEAAAVLRQQAEVLRRYLE